jgi:4-amino-4-deoxy-L-arabinose transferase-like glycosyltransferase
MAWAGGAGGDLERAGQWVAACASALGTIPLFLLARRLFERRVAATAAFLYAIAPLPVRLSAEVLTTGLYLGLTLFALWAAVEAWHGRGVVRHLVAGVAAGLAYLCRVDGMMLAAALVGWTAILAPGEWRARPGRRALEFAALVLGLALAAGPYLLYLRAESGAWSLSRKTNAATFVQHLDASNPDGGAKTVPPTSDPDAGTEPAVAPTAPDQPLTPRVTERRGSYSSALAQWLAAAGRVLRDSAEACPWPLILFLPMGVGWFLRRRPPDWRAFAVLSIPLAFTAALVVFSATHFRESKRYAVPILVWALPWTALGLAWAADLLARALSRCTPRGVLLLLLALYASGISFKTFQPNGLDKRGEREAGEWIRVRVDGRAPVLFTSVPRTAYYAHARLVPLFSHIRFTPESVLHALEECVADYLVVDRHIERNCPGFTAWAEGPGRAHLRLVFRSDKTTLGGAGKDEVRVYEPVR